MNTTTSSTCLSHKQLEAIARNCFDLETLETRHSDDLDFHDIAVWQLREALQYAFELGRLEGLKVRRNS